MPLVGDVGDGRRGIAYSDGAKITLPFVVIDDRLRATAPNSGYVDGKAWGRCFETYPLLDT